MNVTFAHSDYLHLLWLLPVLLLVRWWAARSASTAADSMVAQRLRSLLIASASPVIAWLVFSLQLFSLGFFILTLAQPRWGEDRRAITESGKNLLLALDTSKSMLADDVKPSRLMRAKLAAQDLIERLPEHRVGLVAFAGRSYLQAPLTTDHAAVIEALQALDTFIIPMGGSSISAALQEALDTFEKTKARSHGLVIISDGAEPDDKLDALLAKARQKNVIIISIGVGTELGALIPDPDPERQGDYIRDPATGSPVHTRLEESTLQRMATATNGRYLRLGEKGLDKNILIQTLSTLESMETGNREEVKPIERFYWPLSLGILCLMLSVLIRPTARLPRLSPAAAAAGFVFLLSLQAANGSVLSQQETMEEAQAAYKQQNFTRARDLYARLLADDPPEARAEEFAYGLGAAAHQLKDYDRAIDGFSRALRAPDTGLQARAHHSLGNTLYEQGAKALQQQPDFAIKAWVDSLSHYDAALSIKDDKSIRENFEFVRKKLQILKQQQEEKKQQQQQQKGDKKDQKKGEKGEKGEKQEGEPGEEEGDPQEGDKPGEEQKDGKGKDGKQAKGEEQQAQQGEKIPEGQIKAGEGGEPDPKQQQAMMEEMADQKPDDRTGFSKNEARAFLRSYSDQMQLQFQQRQQDRTVKRDW